MIQHSRTLVGLCLAVALPMVHAQTSGQDSKAEAPKAQEKPKKKGLLGRLNDGLDKLNQKLDTQAQPVDKPAAARQTAPPSAQTAASRVATRPKLNLTCQPTGWKPPQGQDPAAVLPPGWSGAWTGLQPAPPQPAGDFPLASFGHAQSMHVVFPPRMIKDMGTVGREHRIITYRDPAAPFEIYLVLENGRLALGYCDKNAQYHDGRFAGVLERATQPIGYSLVLWNTDKTIIGVIPKDFTCSECYFLDQVFDLGTAAQKIVILADPERQVYFVIKMEPYPAGWGVEGTRSLSKPVQPTSGCTDDVEFLGFKRTVEVADIELFPGVMTNRWYVKRASDRCDQVLLEEIAGKQQAQILELRLER
ncbi:MAG: hypothetical protein JSU00_17025 [Acidobacteria bacterium]|nr:hypothetical protein [Acidobacteriota bacterium]